MTQLIQDILDASIALPRDVNGNPRCYVPVFMFNDKEGNFYRPKYVTKYRGKKFGPGWVFSSYNLREELKYSLEGHI